MTTWLDFAASNALAATVLAVFAWVVSRVCRRPQVVFAVWVLVLAKLVTPPLVALPVESLRGRLDWTPAIVAQEPNGLPASELLESDALPPHLRLPSEPPASLANADPMESLNGSLELDEIAPFDKSIAVPQFDEIEFRLPDLVSLGDVTLNNAAPAAAKPLAMTHVLLAAWLIGSSLWFALAAARIMRFRRLLKLARPAAPDLAAEVRALAGRMRLRQVPEVRVVRRRVSPLIWALGGQATLLLPSDLLRRLTRDERATLLAHELAHLKRRDHLVRLLELAALGLFWWHPVSWWARLNAERAAEHCCDAQVIELFPAQARAYALALWATIDFLSDGSDALPLGASGFSQARHVTRRMEMILTSNRAPRAGQSLRLLLLAIGLAVLPLSLRSLWAEPPAPAAEAQLEDVENVLDGDEAASGAGPAGPVVGPVEIEEQQAEPAEEAIGPVEVEEFHVDPTKQAIAFLVDSQATEEHGEKPTSKAPTIEDRLDRLEKMIQALAEHRPGPDTTPDAKPRPSKAAKPQTKLEKPRRDKAATDALSLPIEDSRLKLNRKDVDLQATRQLADIVRQASQHLELSKSHLARFEAAKRQAEAVKKAYESDTVDLDQLLEAQRRVVESYLSYVRETAELEPKALERQLVVAKAGLAATNHALNDARAIWSKTHKAYVAGSGEDRSEAQAREQYYQFKTQLQKQFDEYKRAADAYRRGTQSSKWRYDTKADTQKETFDVTVRHKLAAQKVDKLAQDKLKMAADSAKHRMADAEKVQQRAKLEIEKAHREAHEARWKLEGLEKHARLREQEAQTAVKAAEAAAKQLEAIKAAEDAAKESTKPEAPK